MLQNRQTPACVPFDVMSGYKTDLSNCQPSPDFTTTHVNAGAIAGICVASIVGGLAVIMACVVAWHHMRFRRKYSSFLQQSQEPVMKVHDNKAHLTANDSPA